MKKELTIHVSFVMELYYYAIQHGAPADKLDAMTGFKAEIFEAEDSRIPLQKFVSLWHAAIELTDNPALALQLGASSRPDETGIVSLVSMSSPSLGEMYARIIRYIQLAAEADRLELVIENEQVKLIYQILVPEYFSTYAVERSFAMALNWSSAFTGQDINPIEIHFQYRAPSYLPEYQKTFNCPLLFEQEHNSIILPESFLDLPAKTYNPYLDKLVQKQAEHLKQNLGVVNSFTEQIQKQIVQDLPIGTLDVDTISEKMNMSRRTLARKLKDEGTSFKALVEETKKELAIDYLKQNKFNINDIAYMLGFSESSAFSRAFKRWFGDNPQAYRNAI